MNSPMEGTTFLYMWLGFLLLMIGSVAIFFFWGIRKGQFSQQDRARYLALQSEIPAVADPDAQNRYSAGEDPHDA
jgi:cbb3-type cytochrome oxidase maturation protein